MCIAAKLWYSVTSLEAASDTCRGGREASRTRELATTRFPCWNHQPGAMFGLGECRLLLVTKGKRKARPP